MTVFTSAPENESKFWIFDSFYYTPAVLPEQNDWYQIQPWKVNEIKSYKNGLTQNWSKLKNWEVIMLLKLQYRIASSNLKLGKCCT